MFSVIFAKKSVRGLYFWSKFVALRNEIACKNSIYQTSLDTILQKFSTVTRDLRSIIFFSFFKRENKARIDFLWAETCDLQPL